MLKISVNSEKKLKKESSHLKIDQKTSIKVSQTSFSFLCFAKKFKNLCLSFGLRKIAGLIQVDFIEIFNFSYHNKKFFPKISTTSFQLIFSTKFNLWAKLKTFFKQSQNRIEMDCPLKLYNFVATGFQEKLEGLNPFWNISDILLKNREFGPPENVCLLLKKKWAIFFNSKIYKNFFFPFFTFL